jgi:short-subunit dehydrogenase
MSEMMSKTALITGASSGVGAEFANQLAALGYDLILVARRVERMEQVADSLHSKFGVNSIVIPADLSNMDDINNVISEINKTPNLELLVNNAGFGTMGKFPQVDATKELTQLMVHMITPVMLCRAAVPEMLSRNKGAIINVSSMAGIVPIRSVLYGTSKAFLINFSIALQAELRHSEVRVQALCPGFIHTEFHDTPEYSRFSRASIPQFLWLQPEQVVSESLKSLQGTKVICIPGLLYRFAGTLARNSFTSGLIILAARFILRKRKH